jgi:hypothetical protein
MSGMMSGTSREPSTCPTPASDCSQGGLWVLQAYDVVDDNWGEQEEGNRNNEEWHTTCPQPHEHLLVGWIMGGMVMMIGDDNNMITTTKGTTRQMGSTGMRWSRGETMEVPKWCGPQFFCYRMEGGMMHYLPQPPLKWCSESHIVPRWLPPPKRQLSMQQQCTTTIYRCYATMHRCVHQNLSAAQWDNSASLTISNDDLYHPQDTPVSPIPFHSTDPWSHWNTQCNHHITGDDCSSLTPAPLGTQCFTKKSTTHTPWTVNNPTAHSPDPCATPMCLPCLRHCPQLPGHCLFWQWTYLFWNLHQCSRSTTACQ